VKAFKNIKANTVEVFIRFSIWYSFGSTGCFRNLHISKMGKGML